MPPSSAMPDLERDARPCRRLVEDEADRSPGEDAQLRSAGPLGLELVGEVEQRPELVDCDHAAIRVKLRPLSSFGTPAMGAMLRQSGRSTCRPR